MAVDGTLVAALGADVAVGAELPATSVDPAGATSEAEVAVAAAKVEALALDRSAVCCNPTVP